MEPTSATDTHRVTLVSCPRSIRKRMRRNLGKAALNRTEKLRAERALELLTSPADGRDVKVVDEKPGDLPPMTPDTKPVSETDHQKRHSLLHRVRTATENRLSRYGFGRRRQRS